jgi:hypothetical protein
LVSRLGRWRANIFPLGKAGWISVSNLRTVSPTALCASASLLIKWMSPEYNCMGKFCDFVWEILLGNWGNTGCSILTRILQIWPSVQWTSYIRTTATFVILLCEKDAPPKSLTGKLRVRKSSDQVKRVKKIEIE